MTLLLGGRTVSAPVCPIRTCGGRSWVLDYDRYLSLLDAYGFHAPLLLHGLREARVPGWMAFLREKLARVAAARSKPGRGSR